MQIPAGWNVLEWCVSTQQMFDRRTWHSSEQVENVHVCLVLKSMLCCREQVPSPGVHHQPPEEVGPGDVVHGVLFGGDGSCSHLRIQMVCQHTEEAGGGHSHTH